MFEEVLKKKRRFHIPQCVWLKSREDVHFDFLLICYQNKTIKTIQAIGGD